MRISWGVLLVLIVLGSVAFAQVGDDDEGFSPGDNTPPDNSHSLVDRRIGIVSPRFLGGGCRPDQVSAVLTEDKKTLSVLFDEFSVSAGGPSGKPRDRKFCDISVPFAVPENHRVSVVKLDFRGFNELPAGGRTNLITSFSMGDPRLERGGRSTRRAQFQGPVQEDFFVSSRMRARPGSPRPDQLRWSKCGQSFDLQIGIALTTQTNARGEESRTVLDSMDVGGDNRIEYALLWQRCREVGRPGPGVGPRRALTR